MSKIVKCRVRISRNKERVGLLNSNGISLHYGCNPGYCSGTTNKLVLFSKQRPHPQNVKHLNYNCKHKVGERELQLFATGLVRDSLRRCRFKLWSASSRNAVQVSCHQISKEIILNLAFITSLFLLFSQISKHFDALRGH